MHMTQCPVIESRGRQFIDGGRRVIRMSGLSTDIRMKKSYGVRSVSAGLERSRQIFHHPFTGVAHTGDRSNFTAAADERLGIGASTERGDVRWQLKLATPAIQWIMIAVNDIRGNVALGQALH